MVQEAYWTNLDWKAISAAGVAMGGIAFPFIRGLYKDWITGRVTLAQTGAQIAETAAARTDRVHAEEYARLLTDREYWRTRAEKAASEAQANEADADNWERDGRGMREWARYYRHIGVNAQNRLTALLTTCERLISGEKDMTTFATTVARVRAEPIVELPAVPMLTKASDPLPPD